MLACAALLAALSIPKLVVAYIAPCEYFQDTAAAGELLENRSGYPSFHPLIKRIVTATPPWAPELLKPLQAAQSRCIAELELNAHPPFLTVLTEPLVAMMGYYKPIFVMNTASLIFLVAIPMILVRYLPMQIPRVTQINIMLLLIASQPVLSTLRNANQSLILAGLLVLGWHYLRQGYEIRGGTALALAASLKVYPAIALGYLFWARRKALAASALVCAGIAEGIALWHGPGIFSEYLKTAQLVASWYTWMRNNYSLHSNLKYYADFSNEQLNRPYALLVGILLLIVFVILFRVRKSKDMLCDLSMAASCTLMCLITPVVWTHYYSMLLLPYAIVFRYSRAWESSIKCSCLLFMLSLNWLHDGTLGWLGNQLGQWIWSLPTLSTLGLLGWALALANPQGPKPNDLAEELALEQEWSLAKK